MTSRRSDRLQRPETLGAVSAFLEDVPDDSFVEVRYRTDEEQLRVVSPRIDLPQPVDDRRSRAGHVRVSHVTDAGLVTVDVDIDAVESIALADPPATSFPVVGATAHERATCLREYADVAPSMVSVSELTSVLGATDQDAVEAGLDVLRTLVAARPDDCVALLPVVRPLLSSSDHRPGVLYAFADLASTRPRDVAPYTAEIAAQLDADDPSARLHAARCLAGVAEADPESVAETTDALGSAVDSAGARTASFAVYALNGVAGEDPGAVAPHVDSLADYVRDSGPAVGLANAIAALGRVTKHRPAAGADAVGDVAPFLDADEDVLRANAAGLLSDVARTDPYVVAPHAGSVAAMLPSDDDFTRANATTCLSHVADAFPERVQPFVPELVALLSDSKPVVRKNACWALGHVGVSTVEAALRRVRKNDDDAAVRHRARWALEQLER